MLFAAVSTEPRHCCKRRMALGRLEAAITLDRNSLRILQPLADTRHYQILHFRWDLGITFPSA